MSDINAEHKSKQIITFSSCNSPIRYSAVAIAIIPTLYIDKLSYVLLLTKTFKAGILKPNPLLPVLGSLDPSVLGQTFDVMFVRAH